MSYVGRCESANIVFLPRANIYLKHAEWTTECATKGSTFYHQGGWYLLISSLNFLLLIVTVLFSTRDHLIPGENIW